MTAKGRLIIGAGGHAKVIADILYCQDIPVLGLIDDNPALIGKSVLQSRVLGMVHQWQTFSPDGLTIGIGNNTVRQQIAEKLSTQANDLWRNATHPNAVLAKDVRVGDGTVIMAGVIVNSDTQIGRHSIVNTGANIDHDCIIGNFSHIAPGCNLAGGVHVGDRAFLGIGCSVIPGCTIGEGAIIGAGAVVISDIPTGVTAMGIPARWK